MPLPVELDSQQEKDKYQNDHCQQENDDEVDLLVIVVHGR